MTALASAARTPSEWLLARFERAVRRSYGPRGDERRTRRDRGGNHERAIFDIINDHGGAGCEPGPDGECFWMRGARWSPKPSGCDDLDGSDDLPAVA